MTRRAAIQGATAVTIAAAAIIATTCARRPVPMVEDVRKFLDNANDTMKRLPVAQNRAGWVEL